MEQSEQVGELMKALAGAQAEFSEVKRRRTGKISGEKAGGGSYEYSYKYADLADVLKATQPQLLKFGLVVTQVTHASSGQWQRTYSPPMPVATDPKRTGAGMMYGRRYGVSAALCIATEEDKDAAGDWEGTQGRGQQRPQGRAQVAQERTAGRTQAQTQAGGGDVFTWPYKPMTGKTLDEIPTEYLTWYTEKGQQEELRKRAADYLRKMVTDEDEQGKLAFYAERIEGINAERVKARLEEQRGQHHGRVPREWFDTAYESITSALSVERERDLEAEYLLLLEAKDCPPMDETETTDDSGGL